MPPTAAGVSISAGAAYLKRAAVRERSARKVQVCKIPMNFGIPDLGRVRAEFTSEDEESSLIGALGPVFEDDIPVVTDTSAENFFAAVDKRVNYQTSEAADETLAASLDLLNSKIPEQQAPIEWSEELFEDWNSHNDAGKQKRMIAALEQFERFTQREFGAKDIFTKVELLLKRHDAEWAGRLVNNSTDLHNAISGPILQAATKRLNYILDHMQPTEGKEYFLGYGAATIDKVADLVNSAGDKPAFIVECDFSSNDMMQVKTAVLCETAWLERLGAPTWLIQIMLDANVYKVYNRDFQFSATVSNQLPSGSTSTTFRNCIWNMSIFHQWTLFKHPGQNTAAVTRSRAFFLGDDMLALIYVSRYVKSVRSRKRAGKDYEYVANRRAKMKAKVKVHETLHDAEFLSKHFCPTSNGWRMFPKLGRALCKINVRANNNPNLSNPEYMLGKLLSYAFEYRYLPLVKGPLLAKAVFIESSFGLKAEEIAMAAFTYNYAKVVREFGRGPALAMLDVDPEKEITDDDIGMWLGYRYGWDCSDLSELMEMLLWGEDDIPRAFYQPLAERDFW